MDTKKTVTNAGLCNQKTITSILKTLYPGLKVIGSNDQALKESPTTIKPHTLIKDITNKVKAMIPLHMLNDKLMDREDFVEKVLRNWVPDEICDLRFDTFDKQSATVWVDPVEGTHNLINGTLSGVAVLIGLTINGVSKASVMHKPFLVDSDDKKEGITFFATAEHGAFKLKTST
jgi:3'-phosphoadenosine 5'-phosphosulfate (PAPS) 3'-phosphatase